VSDGKVVLTGRTSFVTVDMVSGKPKRMPPEFVEAYRRPRIEHYSLKMLDI